MAYVLSAQSWSWKPTNLRKITTKMGQVKNCAKCAAGGFLSIFMAISLAAHGQCWLRGAVRDADTWALLPDVAVQVVGSAVGGYTDAKGYFEFSTEACGVVRIRLSLLGYEANEIEVDSRDTATLQLHMHPSQRELAAVRVTADYKAMRQKQAAVLRTLEVKELKACAAPSLAQTLEAMPGMHAMSIGRGASKPMIRGMGLNRIAVVDRGIKQEGQQWGSDHALEIDQKAVRRVNVYKGAMSLRYGGDAMGGVVAINEHSPLPAQGLHADGEAWGESNGWLAGGTLGVSWLGEKFFIEGRGTYAASGDYRVPTDTINYLSFLIPLYDRYLKNTATKESAATITAGMQMDKLGTFSFTGSFVAQRMGLFPGSHGVPSIARVLPDGNRRDIGMPSASVDHWKGIINYVSPHLVGCWRVFVDLGYQRNLRAEYSPFHTHYVTQPEPVNNPNLELSFDLTTVSGQLRTEWRPHAGVQLCFGTDGQWQRHDYDGYGFLLPSYRRATGGAYAMGSWQCAARWRLEGGVRFDVGYFDIDASYDAYLAEYLRRGGAMGKDEVAQYAQRAPALRRLLYDASWSVGALYDASGVHSVKMYLGQSFRLPGVNELASNGMHHGAFRHEQGDADLKSEKGIQLDVEYRYRGENVEVAVSPFGAYYFSYIFLEPTGRWSVLPHAGQLYRYRTARSAMGGGEAEVQWRFGEHYRVEANVAALWQRNLTDGYPLPFCPPAKFQGEGEYRVHGIPNRLGALYLLVHPSYTLAQLETARNESPTQGYALLDATLRYEVEVEHWHFNVSFQCNNIFNKKYFNHLSFYRTLNIPEVGRSFRATIGVTI